MPKALTAKRQREAVAELCERDPDIAEIVERAGSPGLWSRPAGFSTLVYIVLEQQVSLASARATYDRLRQLLPNFDASAYLALSDEQLLDAGVSRQKRRYTRLIAEAVLDGSLPITKLARYSDLRARELLTAITGVGVWTADVYLMAALRRPDLWPVGDLALVKAVQDVKTLGEKVALDDILRIGEGYRPYRSVATRIFWQHYLHKPRVR